MLKFGLLLSILRFCSVQWKLRGRGRSGTCVYWRWSLAGGRRRDVDPRHAVLWRLIIAGRHARLQQKEARPFCCRIFLPIVHKSVKVAVTPGGWCIKAKQILYIPVHVHSWKDQRLSRALLFKTIGAFLVYFAFPLVSGHIFQKINLHDPNKNLLPVMCVDSAQDNVLFPSPA